MFKCGQVPSNTRAGNLALSALLHSAPSKRGGMSSDDFGVTMVLEVASLLDSLSGPGSIWVLFTMVSPALS